MFKLITVDEVDLICYDDGNIWRQNKKYKEEVWCKFVSECEGYLQIGINKKRYLVSRIIADAFKEDFTLDSELVVDHKNHDIHDNSVANLRCITNQQNQFNRSNTKGYIKKSYIKKDGTEVEYWEIKLMINRKSISKSVATEEEARQGYLELKRIHHII